MKKFAKNQLFNAQPYLDRIKKFIDYKIDRMKRLAGPGGIWESDLEIEIKENEGSKISFSISNHNPEYGKYVFDCEITQVQNNFYGEWDVDNTFVDMEDGAPNEEQVMEMLTDWFKEMNNHIRFITK